MSKLRTLAISTISGHYALFFYYMLSRISDFLLYLLLYVTGVFGILFMSLTKEVYEKQFDYLLASVTGVTSFLSSLYLSVYFPIFMSVFKWAMGIAFWYGGLRSLRLVDSATIVKKNIIYSTLILVLNVVSAIFNSS